MPRGPRAAYHEPVADPAAATRDIAAVLLSLIARADAAGLAKLAGLLASALEEADLGAGHTGANL